MTERNLIEIDISDAIRGLDNIETRSRDTAHLMDILAEVLLSGVQDNYEAEQGPDGPWPALAKSTRKDRQKKGYKPDHPMLVRSRQLFSSMQPHASRKEAHVSTNKIYAPIQFLGGQAGPGRKVTIPSRNPLWINPETDREIDAEVDHWFDEI